jgi:hypothetical protein
LNAALFGKTAGEWRKENPKLQGNMRDHATLEQLVVLSNLESLNSVLIHQGLPRVRAAPTAQYDCHRASPLALGLHGGEATFAREEMMTNRMKRLELTWTG